MNKQGLLKDYLQLLTFNAIPFLMFEMLYLALGAIVVAPLFIGMLNFCMGLSGLEYLGSNNLVHLLTFPATWAAAIVFVALASMYALFDIIASILFLDLSKRRVRASIRTVCKTTAIRTRLVLKPANWPFMLMVLIVLPLFGFILAPSFIGSLEVPEFILTAVFYSPLLTTLLVVLWLAAIAFVILAIYAFHFFTLQGCTFKQAVKQSANLRLRRRPLDVLFCMAMIIVLKAISVLVPSILLPGVVLLGDQFQADGPIWETVDLIVSAGLVLITAFISFSLVACQAPLCYTAVSALFYRHLEDEGLPSPACAVKGSSAKPSKTTHRIVAGIALIAGYAASVALLCLFYNGIDISSETQGQTGVIAHRCGAAYAPENTVAALRNAAAMGAGWCEIDVQMCSDGSIIVIHDSSLLRTGGLDKNTWEATYDEVRQLDAGSIYGAEYAGERIPLLTEMIAAAQECGVKLQIEIKPTGHDEGIEQAVVDIIHSMNFQDDCQVLSLSLECLEKVKAYDPTMYTTYLMSLSYGNVASIDAADSYSIESMWITFDLAENIHSKEGAVLCAWTVSTDEGVRSVIERGADMVVTDNIEVARTAIDNLNTESSLLESILGRFSKTNRGERADD